MYILILSLAFALLVAIFAVQNSSPVMIHILWTTQEIPLVLVILGSALAGAFIVFLLAVWREFSYRRRKSLESKTPSQPPVSVNGQAGKGKPKATEQSCSPEDANAHERDASDDVGKK